MRRHLGTALATCTLLAAGGVASAADVTLHGTVVDENGAPVAGATVATSWQHAEKGLNARSGVTTDTEGKFSLSVTTRGASSALMAVDEGRLRGAVAIVQTDDAGSAVTLRIQPLVRVKARFHCDFFGGPPARTSVYAMVGKQRARVVYTSTEDGTIEFALPPGEYTLWILGTDVNSKLVKQEITAGRDEVDIGTVDLSAKTFAMHYGKEPPEVWSITETRGVDAGVQLADFRGKWVLLEFWGFW